MLIPIISKWSVTHFPILLVRLTFTQIIKQLILSNKNIQIIKQLNKINKWEFFIYEMWRYCKIMIVRVKLIREATINFSCQWVSIRYLWMKSQLYFAQIMAVGDSNHGWSLCFNELSMAAVSALVLCDWEWNLKEVNENTQNLKMTQINEIRSNLI